MSDRRRLIEASALLTRWVTDGIWDNFASADQYTYLEEDTQAWLDECAPPERGPMTPWRARLERYLTRPRGSVVFRIPEDLDELVADWRRLGGK